MFILVCVLAVALLILVAGFFYTMTNHIFVVEFGSGVWFFAVVLYALLILVSATYIFHPRFNRMPRWEKLATGGIILIASAVCITLGIKYRPFLNIKVDEKLGAFVDNLLSPSVPEFPPAKAEASIETPPTLDQARASTCWAYAAALLLSTMLNKNVDPGKSKTGCVEMIDVSKWSVSPQALIDLFDSNDKNGGAPAPEGLRIASSSSLPSLHCVSGYTSQFNGNVNSCKCNAPKNDWCLLRSSGQNEHSVCSDGSPAKKSDFFRNKSVVRLRGVEIIERAVSSGYPVLVWLAFKRNGYPLWTGVENDGITLKFRSPNFIARPRDEKQYEVDKTIGGHAVCIIGFGSRSDGVKYWEIQNSWGPNWGISGKAKIERGVNAWAIEEYGYIVS